MKSQKTSILYKSLFGFLSFLLTANTIIEMVGIKIHIFEKLIFNVLGMMTLLSIYKTDTTNN